MRREYMIQFREKNGIDLMHMAKKCKISRTLLEMLEASDQEVTHPKIAERVSKAYKLNKEQAEGLLPENYRKSSPNYDPSLYKRYERDDGVDEIADAWITIR